MGPGGINPRHVFNDKKREGGRGKCGGTKRIGFEPSRTEPRLCCRVSEGTSSESKRCPLHIYCGGRTETNRQKKKKKKCVIGLDEGKSGAGRFHCSLAGTAISSSPLSVCATASQIVFASLDFPKSRPGRQMHHGKWKERGGGWGGAGTWPARRSKSPASWPPQRLFK